MILLGGRSVTKNKVDLFTKPEHKLERHKTFNEYLRFLTTLSTGSIVLLTTLLEHSAPQPKAISLVSVALISFMVSIIGSVLAYTSTTFHTGIDLSDVGNAMIIIGLMLAWLSFIVAIVSLTVFALMNLK
jgi:hypothetical protein